MDWRLSGVFIVCSAIAPTGARLLKNRLTALFAALLLCGACYVLLAGLVDRGWPFEDVLLMSVAATLTLSALAATLGYRAWLRSFEIRAEFRRLAVSVDAAFRELAGRANRDRYDLADINEHISREIERLAERLEADRAVPPAAFDPPAQGDNIVPHPATRRSRREPVIVATPQTGAAEAQAIHRAVANGAVELSLQPIVSIAQGAAVGFDVYAHLDLGDGRSTDIRRATDLVRSSEQAAFERSLVMLAAQAARRRLGDAGEAMPLHVAISAPLLEHAAELAVVLDLFRQYPALAQSLVLSVPAGLFETATASLERLAAAGVRLAAEGERSPVAALGKFGVAFIKLPASALLNARETGNAARRMDELLDAPAGMQLIVTDVAEDEQAVRLIDLGIDLMSGARFSGPRLLRALGTGNASRLAAVQEPPPASSAG